MEACRKIFIELNGIDVLRQTPQKRLWYPKGPASVGVGIPQVYKLVTSVALLVAKKKKKRPSAGLYINFFKAMSNRTSSYSN